MLEQGEIMPYVDASIMMILEIGIGVICAHTQVVNGTTNHLLHIKSKAETVTLLLALNAPTRWKMQTPLEWPYQHVPNDVIHICKLYS